MTKPATSNAITLINEISWTIQPQEDLVTQPPTYDCTKLLEIAPSLIQFDRSGTIPRPNLEQILTLHTLALATLHQELQQLQTLLATLNTQLTSDEPNKLPSETTPAASTKAKSKPPVKQKQRTEQKQTVQQKQTAQQKSVGDTQTNAQSAKPEDPTQSTAKPSPPTSKPKPTQ